MKSIWRRIVSAIAWVLRWRPATAPEANTVRMPDTYTFAHARELTFRFESLLKSVGITIRSSSVLERLCLNTIDLCEKHEHPELRPGNSVDLRPSYREMVGLYDFLVKLVAAGTHPDFPQLLPHLRLLNEGNPLQSVNTSVLDQENNKLFELYVAALCLGIPVTDLTVDDPHSPSGDNPDVLATYDGKRWGLACKALHSSAPKTIMDAIRKAVDQIERSGAQSGFPVLTAKNIIPHDEIWPVRKESELTGAPGDGLIFISFPTIARPVGMLQEQATHIRDALVREFGPEELLRAFTGKKAQPACLIYLPSATSVVHGGRPVPARLNVLQVIPFDKTVEPAAWRFAEALNHRLQSSDA
jgi:hypothetical protein